MEDILKNRLFNGGHNKKVKQTIEDQIVAEYKSHPSSTSTAIAIKLSESGVDLDNRSVRRARVSLGFTKVKSSLLPTLSEENRNERLNYCIMHKNDLFSNACFTDESCFQLLANKQVLWYRKGFEPKPALNAPKQNLKVMIWGGISRRGKTPLHIYRLDKKEKVNKETYIECLEENLLESMDRKYGEGRWRFLQDNARPHVARETKEFFKDEAVKIIKNPPYSPDLNPIEQIWAWMKRDVAKISYKTIDDLISAIEDKWQCLTVEFQNKVIDHHCKVVNDVRKSKGGYV